jgi:hypothetical protein
VDDERDKRDMWVWLCGTRDSDERNKIEKISYLPYFQEKKNKKSVAHEEAEEEEGMRGTTTYNSIRKKSDLNSRDEEKVFI